MLSSSTEGSGSVKVRVCTPGPPLLSLTASRWARSRSWSRTSSRPDPGSTSVPATRRVQARSRHSTVLAQWAEAPSRRLVWNVSLPVMTAASGPGPSQGPRSARSPLTAWSARIYPMQRCPGPMLREMVVPLEPSVEADTVILFSWVITVTLDLASAWVAACRTASVRARRRLWDFAQRPRLLSLTPSW